MIDCFQSYDDNLQMPITTTSYHKWLKILNIYSLQRRKEGYAINYIFKIFMQLVPNPGVKTHCNLRTKIKVTPKHTISSVSPVWANVTISLRNGSFFVTGPQLYNSIPATLRELENGDEREKQKVENELDE